MAEEEWKRILQTKAEHLQESWDLRFAVNLELGCRGWKEFMQYTCARFQCSRCRKHWSGGSVVVFHMRRMSNDSIVRVKRYRQKCRDCREATMEEANIHSEIINILLENLVLFIRKKYYHEDLPEEYRVPPRRQNRTPHESDHCEACIAGICPHGRPN